jgi:hypothetical protein
VNVAAALVVGLVETFDCVSSLGRFGQFVPRVVVLAALRELAVGMAVGLTWLTAVVVVHRASRNAQTTSAMDAQAALVLGVTMVLVAYPLDVAAMCLAAIAIPHWVYGGSLSNLLAFAGAAVVPSDMAVGLAKVVVSATIATLLFPRALRAVATSRRSLALKLLVAWLVAQFGFFVVDEGFVFVLGRLR